MNKIFLKAIPLLFVLPLLLFSCEDNSKKSGGLIDANYFVITTDYSTGSYSLFNSGTVSGSADIGSGLIHSDAVGRYYNGLVYVLNRLGRDNLQIIDPDEGYATTGEYSTGTSSNPQDIAFYSDAKAYISRYGASSLLVINPDSGETVSTIDLSAYSALSNGTSHMSALYLYGSYLFVAVQRLDSSFSPTDKSYVVVINTATDTVTKAIELSWTGVSATNPYTAFHLVTPSQWQPSQSDGHDHLLIGCVGAFGYNYAEDGGIIAIDPVDLAVEAGYIVSEAAIGAEITGFAFTENGALYLVTSDKNFSSALVEYDTAAASVVETLYSDDSNLGALNGVEIDEEGRLLLLDRNATGPGIRIFDTADGNNQLNDGKPVDMGLPPYMLVSLKEDEN